MNKINTESRNEIENTRRNKLQQEKPQAYEKIIRLPEKEARGEAAPVIDFSYDYACNMKCTHCSNARFEKRGRCFTLDDVRDLSRQADDLGLAQFSISGGEPLVFPELDEIIKAIDPQKFHIALNTNGILLTEERAFHLKEIGLDKVKISLDSFDEAVYMQTRQQDGAYQKVFRALDACEKAGLQPAIQTVVSHQSCQTKSTEALAKYAHERKMNLDLIAAKAIGNWEGKEEVLLTTDDSEYLVNLRNQYPEVHRDVFPTYGKSGGCIAVKCVINITKYGDVFPCPFMHISIGNIFEEPLKDILKRGMSIKWFNKYHPICLAGEDRNYIRKYMSKFYGKPLPISWRDAYTAEDFVERKI